MKNAILLGLMATLTAFGAYAQSGDTSIPRGIYQRSDGISADTAEEQSNVGEISPSVLNVVISAPAYVHFKLRTTSGRNGAGCSVEGRGNFDGTSYVSSAQGCTVYLTRALDQIFVTSRGEGCSKFCGNAELETEFPIR